MGTYRLPESVLTKKELGTNSSSESESGFACVILLLSNIRWFSWTSEGGGGELYCSTGVDEAVEQGKGGPFSVFSCSVSVRVSAEFARLDKQELREDFTFLPQSLIALSGDMTPSVSVSASEPVLREYPR